MEITKKKKSKASVKDNQVCKNVDTTLSNSELCQTVPEGNTNTSGTKPKNNPVYRWVFTLKSKIPESVPIVPENYQTEIRQLWETLNKIAKEFYFQLEKGQSGFIHYQGCFSLIDKDRFDSLKNNLGYRDIHLEQCIDWNASKLYCSKKDTQISKPYNHNSIFVDIPHLKYRWQVLLKNRLLTTKPHKRRVEWYIDTIGGKGKSDFTKNLLLTSNKIVNVVTGGSGKDIAMSLNDNPDIIIFDLPRTTEGFVSYNVIEQCKNGMVFSPKYESKFKCFNVPHIIIFANFGPDISKLSADRWDIIDTWDMREELNIENIL